MRAAMTNVHGRSAKLRTQTDNVILFSGARRACAAATVPLQRDRRAATLTDAEINFRLLALLGICVTSAVLALSAIHILHG